MPTTDAVKILEHELEKDPELAALVEEETQLLRIADKIRQTRKEAGLSQKELANRINTTQSVISRLESNSYERLSLHTLLKISTALNCNLIIELQPKDE